VEEIRSLFLARPGFLMADLGLQRQAESARQRILIDPRGWRDPAESIARLPVLLDALWRGQRVRFLYQGVREQSGRKPV
jgi:hypothetical protein